MAIGDFFNKFFSKENINSKDVAKERLRLILVQDRANALPDEVMMEIRAEIIKIISKYMDIDESQLDVALTKSDNEVALVANIPVVRIKRDVS